MGWCTPWVDLSAHIISHRFNRHRLPILRLLHLSMQMSGGKKKSPQNALPALALNSQAVNSNSTSAK